MHFKWEILPIDDRNQGIFPKIRALFSNCRKRAGDTSPLFKKYPWDRTARTLAHSTVLNFNLLCSTSISSELVVQKLSTCSLRFLIYDVYAQKDGWVIQINQSILNFSLHWTFYFILDSTQFRQLEFPRVCL